MIGHTIIITLMGALTAGAAEYYVATNGAGSNEVWGLDTIVRMDGASHVRVSGMHIPVAVSSDQFDHACIRINSCDGIVLDNLWLSGPRSMEARNGHGIYVSGTAGADGVVISHVLVEEFGQGFYTTAIGGWAHSNILRYCTIAEQDGSFDIDDGLGAWHREGSGAAGNHLRAERCIFANVPANRATFGVGMRVDNSLNLNDEGNVIIYSFENNDYNCGADGMSWHQPVLSELEDNSATNDVSLDPQFYINSDGLPYCSDLDYGWQPVPEAGACGLLALLALAARRTAPPHAYSNQLPRPTRPRNISSRIFPCAKPSYHVSAPRAR